MVPQKPLVDCPAIAIPWRQTALHPLARCAARIGEIGSQKEHLMGREPPGHGEVFLGENAAPRLVEMRVDQLDEEQARANALVEKIVDVKRFMQWPRRRHAEVISKQRPAIGSALTVQPSRLKGPIRAGATEHEYERSIGRFGQPFVQLLPLVAFHANAKEGPTLIHPQQQGNLSQHVPEGNPPQQSPRAPLHPSSPRHGEGARRRVCWRPRLRLARAESGQQITSSGQRITNRRRRGRRVG